ncbi:MAG: ComF family protein [Chloracidobacterium sp.]|nr:ComF family protein [Chloracidobacterium sp.]
MIAALRNSLFSLVYPQECRVCSAHVEDHSDGTACRECWTTTRLFDGTEMLCNKCGAFFGDKAAPVAVYCRQCDDHHYSKAVALGIYEKALAAAIVNLKTAPSLPSRLRSMIRSSGTLRSLNEVDTIIPIPLSRLRRRERGFNQAEIIAGPVSAALCIPLDSHSLTRKLPTPIHRIGMDRKARELTVKNAFEVARPKLINGKNILLVDDVFTSGATASACARILKKHGADKISVFTLARAVMK